MFVIVKDEVEVVVLPSHIWSKGFDISVIMRTFQGLLLLSVIFLFLDKDSNFELTV